MMTRALRAERARTRSFDTLGCYVTGGSEWSKHALFSAPSMSSVSLALAPGLSELASDYDVILSDVWGVVHNGVAASKEACEALARFRADSGTVILISNAPRPGTAVIRHLDSLGVPGESYDRIVTSGDVTRNIIANRLQHSVLHLGPERDASLFSGLPVRFAPLENADYVVCSGLYHDEWETPADYDDVLQRMLSLSLLMVCANPDIVVERGERLLYCAGALAERYAGMGGEVLYTGKPHRPIYEAALAQAFAARGREAPLSRFLAIGDSVRTDLAGAARLGMDCLFVTSGIHAEELGRRDHPDLAKLNHMFAAAGVWPRAVVRRLEW